MTFLAEFVQEARRDFIAAGPEGQHVCPPNASGWNGSRMCIAFRAAETQQRLWDGVRADMQTTFDNAWHAANGEWMVYTNERGFADSVAGYDQLILHLTTPVLIPTDPQEVTA